MALYDGPTSLFFVVDQNHFQNLKLFQRVNIQTIDGVSTKFVVVSVLILLNL